MIVFVTGGTGALGRPTIQLLRQRGHQVRALAHTSAARTFAGRRVTNLNHNWSHHWTAVAGQEIPSNELLEG